MKIRSKKRRRIITLALMLSTLGASVALVMFALQDEIVFFQSPTEIVTSPPLAGSSLRVGGLVEDGSVKRSANGLTVAFKVTDGQEAVPVSYQGILPDLFREGQGVVVEGTMQSGTFVARTVLAKHDEEYMPREVKAALANNQFNHSPTDGEMRK